MVKVYKSCKHDNVMRRKGEDMLAIYDLIWRLPNIGFRSRFEFTGLGLGSKVEVDIHKNLIGREQTCLPSSNSSGACCREGFRFRSLGLGFGCIVWVYIHKSKPDEKEG